MQIIGHRGSAPENTLIGIKSALKKGVDWIEIDVRVTEDGQLVVVHDRHTGRVAPERLVVKRSALTRLRALVTRGGGRIPTLSEVLAAVQHKARINIEIKTKDAARQVAQVVSALFASGYARDEIIVSSFWPAALRQVHRIDTTIPLALLDVSFPFNLFIPHGFKLFGIGLHRHQVNWFTVRLAKWRRLFVYVYTVNKPSTAQQLEKLGVDAIVTDNLDEFLPPKKKTSPGIKSQGITTRRRSTKSTD